MNRTRYQFRDGDLLRNNHTGALRQVQGEEFTKRFMDAQDHEMAAHGMGHLAGSYGGALRTLPLDDIDSLFGQGVYTVKTSDIRRRWSNLTALAERHEESINEAS
jgi:hypothetical protein